MTPEAARTFLHSLAGEWEGTNSTWFEPDALADVSPIEGSIRPVPGAPFVLHEYRSALEGNPFHGVAIYGYDSLSDRFEAAWADSFHMNTNLMVSVGAAAPDGFSVLGSYSDPGGGPSWGWRTEIEVHDGDRLTITAYNVSPGGEESKAVETAYTRKRGAP